MCKQKAFLNFKFSSVLINDSITPPIAPYKERIDILLTMLYCIEGPD